MILVDTSAWVEFLRSTGSPVHVALRRLLDEGADLAVTEVVVMELLAGAPRWEDVRQLRSTLLSLTLLELRGLLDYEEAASIYRSCRAAGETPRSLLDCLVAVPAIRAGAAVLHRDRDYELIARHTGLRVHPLDP